MFYSLLFIDGLKEFVTMIKDYLLSILNGLKILVTSLAQIVNISQSASWWLPSAVFGIMMLSFTLIVVLRVIGR